MRESIGTSFMLNFIILFIFLVFAFLAGTLSYYKSYRINNFIVNAIEKFEGYNHYSQAEIVIGLKSLGYDISVSSNCPATREITHVSYKPGGELEYVVEGKHVNNNDDEGYCIYLFMDDNGPLAHSGNGVETTDRYYTYGVLTYMKLRFPVVENVLKIPIFSRTNRMYYFE
jgi:hypothetical protein